MNKTNNKKTTTQIKQQKILALWAADCAEHVLKYFEAERPKDKRPRQAIEAARAWTHGRIRVGEARKAALAAHAAARATTNMAAKAAARACGHAAATAHVATHAFAVPYYALKASQVNSARQERDWEIKRLSPRLRPLANSYYKKINKYLKLA